MLQANELRIGNYLQWNGKPFKVNTIFTSHVCSETQPLQGYEPIPLTPEILEKCGYKVQCEYFFFKKDELIEFEKLKHCYSVRFKQSGMNSLKIAEIKYVHQLQNLIFAVSGNELEINL